MVQICRILFWVINIFFDIEKITLSDNYYMECAPSKMLTLDKHANKGMSQSLIIFSQNIKVKIRDTH
jgi:hypothetical protein